MSFLNECSLKQRNACCRQAIRFVPRSKNEMATYCIRLAECTSISSILKELSSSLILCARAGVRRLAVDGSDRLSYVEAEKVSYIERVAANVMFFFVAFKLLAVGAVTPELEPPLNIVESAGAEEFAAGWVYAKLGPLSDELAKAPGVLERIS